MYPPNPGSLQYLLEAQDRVLGEFPARRVEAPGVPVELVKYPPALLHEPQPRRGVRRRRRIYPVRGDHLFDLAHDLALDIVSLVPDEAKLGLQRAQVPFLRFV